MSHRWSHVWEFGGWRALCRWTGLVVLATAVSAQAVRLRGEIQRVGYPGSSSDAFVSVGDIYRVGRWTPVVVELANEDGDQFEGVIEVRQTDADGDDVVARREVVVRGRGQFTLYVPGGPISEDNFVRGAGYEGPAPFTVRVFDRKGRLAHLLNDQEEPVKELRPPRQVIPASPDALLILDMSSPPVNHLDRLKEVERVQEFMLMRCSPKDMPGAVVGLELVDAIVWDAPNPGSLDPQQNEAIREWVRRGGRLIVGVGRTWNDLAQSEFGPLLPARLKDSKSTTKREDVLELIQGADEEEAEERRTIAALNYCPLTRENLASDAVPVLPRMPKPDEQIWAVRRICGRGEILLVPAELKDALALNAGDENLTFLRLSLLRLRQTSESRDQMGSFNRRDLFTRVGAQTAFQMTSSLYFAFAFAFVIAYIIVVTGGTWGWLRRRGGIRHAWLASALLAAGASGVSLGAVQLVRTLGQGVHEMTIVDGQVGSYDAVATSYLGLKTASHTEYDVCVPTQWTKPSESPETRASLRPYASESGAEQRTTFAVPQRYDGVAEIGELRSVPLRATLKQFEATWRGALDGRMAASLRLKAGRDELDASSWVENQLGTDLRDCYLFTRSGTQAINVYTIGQLAAGERVDWGKVCRTMEEQLKKRRSQLRPLRGRVDALTDEEKSAWTVPMLRVLLDQCLRDLNVQTVRGNDETWRDPDLVDDTAAPYVAPLLLLTFFDDGQLSGLLYPNQQFSRSQGRDLEMSARLQTGTALFVGFAESPGPLRLCRRKPGAEVDSWKPMTPARSAVMYRFTAPLQ